MRHQVQSKRFDRPTGHRLSMLRNLVTDLLRYEKIVTTEAKAKQVRSLAEKMITVGKAGDLAARKRAIAHLYDETVAHKLFTVIGPRYVERHGGYTRMVKLAPRLGDRASMVQLELVK